MAGPSSPETLSEKELRTNLIAFFVHGFLGQTGFRLLQAPTFLPTFVTALTGSSGAAGLARSIQSLGMFLSPWLAARMIERRSQTKALGMLFGAAMRLQILFLALLALIAPLPVARVALWPVLGAWGLCSGMQMVTFQFLLSKSVPTRHRGRLHGGRNFASGITLLVVSAVAGLVVQRYGFPKGYGLAFLLAFVLTSLGLLSLLALRETATARPRQPLGLLTRLRQFPRLLRQERSFAGFLRARLLATCGRGALPYYVLAVSERSHLDGVQIGGLTAAFAVSQGIAAVAWGFVADHSGFRRVFLLALACWMCGSLVVLVGGGRLSVAYLIFILVGAGYGGFMMASQNLVLEFGSDEDRAMRIATTSSLSEAVGTLGFLAAGVAATLVPLATLFVASLALHAVAAFELLRMRDPRHLTEPEHSDFWLDEPP